MLEKVWGVESLFIISRYIKCYYYGGFLGFLCILVILRMVRECIYLGELEVVFRRDVFMFRFIELLFIVVK